MLVSRPLCEKRHTAVVEVPLAGRARTSGLPANAQLLFAVEKAPSAAIFNSPSSPGSETPSVVGSTTTISFPVAAGTELVSEITSSEVPGATTTRETAFDLELSGFRICADTLPATATSDGFTGAVH